MKGLIDANHTLGKYNVDLSSKSEYASSKAQIALIDEQLTKLNETLTELTSEYDQALEDWELLGDTINNIINRLNIENTIKIYNNLLNEMPEGPERDALEAEKEKAEQDLADAGGEDEVWAGMSDLEAEIQKKQETWEEMPEGPEADNLEAEIDTMQDIYQDKEDLLDRPGEIDKQLNAMPDGPERDWTEAEVARLEAELAELEAEFNNSKADLEALGLGIDLNGSLESILHAVQEERVLLSKDVEQIKNEMARLNLEIKALELKRARLENQKESEVQVLIYNVWCVDLTEDLSGFVGIINILPITSEDTEEEYDNEAESEALQEEIAALDAKIDALAAQIADPEDSETLAALNLLLAAFELRKKKIEADNKYKKQKTLDTINRMVNNGGFQIQPGYEGNAAYDSARDDVPVPDAYRYGIITEIDYGLNTCTVNLGDLVNSV